MAGKLIIITAPSGSGKTTICRHLLQTFPKLRFSVSATTRAKREGEIDGKDYYFLSQEEFVNKVSNNMFLEFEEVYSGSLYGTLKSEVDRLWEEGCDVLFDIDVQGAMRLKNIFADRALMIFVKTPLDQLETRLRARNSENEETLKTRLDKAAIELEFLKHADTVVVNEVLEKAVKDTETAVSIFIQ